MAVGRAAAVVILCLASTSSGCAGPEGQPEHGELVAAVDRTTLTVDEVAELLSPFDMFANVEESVRSVAEMWIEYTLLAEALAQDPDLENVDLTAFQEVQNRQRIILGLRDEAVQADTALTDDEVYQRFVEEDIGLEIRARHILLTPADEATPAQRDSTRAFAESVRQMIMNGESFESMAARYSVDGSASSGGDLGYFRRGQMVAPFEEAAFALEPGELSEIVETQFGFHIILVEERRQPDFEESRDQVRRQIQAQIQAVAESVFIAEVEEPANVSLTPGAVEAVGSLFDDLGTPMSSGERRAALVEYDGGEVTAGEIETYFNLQPRELRYQTRELNPTQREALLRNFARQELLLAEADRIGIESPSESETSPEVEANRQQTVANARMMQLNVVEPEGGESEAEAVQRRVHETIRLNLAGDLTMPALGPTVGILRAERDTRLYPEALARVVERVQELREAEGYEPFRRDQDAGVGQLDVPSAEVDSTAGDG